MQTNVSNLPLDVTISLIHRSMLPLVVQVVSSQVIHPQLVNGQFKVLVTYHNLVVLGL